MVRSGGYGDLNAANAFDATNSSHSTRAMIAGPFLFMPNRTGHRWYCDGACDGIGATSFGLCSIRCGRLEISHVYKLISNEALHIPRERDNKIPPTRNSAAVRNAVTFTDENDRVSRRIPATHPGGLFHSLAYCN